MARDNITLTEIVNHPSINAGIGGWDGSINTFITENIGRHRVGLLSRATGIDHASEFNLIVVPAGWYALPTMFVVTADQGDPGSINLNIGPGGDSDLYVDNVSLTNLSTTSPVALLYPKSALGDIFHAATAIAWRPLDGDAAFDRYCKADLTGVPASPIDIAAYGLLWPKSDT